MNYKNTNSSFYQLTPNILLEYIHFNTSTMVTSDLVKMGYSCPNFTGNFESVKQGLSVYVDRKSGTKYIVNKRGSVTSPDVTTNNSFYNTSLATNKSETRYIKLGDSVSTYPYTPEDIVVGSGDTIDTNMVHDIIVLHLTNGNYLQDYDGFIVSINILDDKNNKIYLSSAEFLKSDTPEYEDTPLLIADTLYTTKFQFRIPNVEWLASAVGSGMREKLIGRDLQENTPLSISLKGITKTYEDGGTVYDTHEITKTNAPYIDKYEGIDVSIDESKDGDYFTIDASAPNQSLSDYLQSHGIDNATIMHDIMVTERYYDVIDEKVKTAVTRKEYFISSLHPTEEDNTVDDTITFRPIAMMENVLSFTIQDTLRIYNNLDNTTIVKVGSRDYGTGEGESVYKYGRFMQAISNPAIYQVKLFNKRTDVNNSVVKIVNTQTAGFKAPDNVAVTKFIDAKNIAISVQQVTLN